MPPVVKGAITNVVIAAAQDVPQLVAGLETVDPAMADAIKGKALLASKTPWGVLLAGVASWAVSHYGLGWNATTTDMMAGAGVLLGSYLMRYISPARITGIFSAPAVPVVPVPIPATVSVSGTKS